MSSATRPVSRTTDPNIRAERFLSDVMGKKIYKKFVKHGKIEIRSRKFVYILDRYGRIINKTTKSEYCIILGSRTPDRENIPLCDTIAIKYCWIKYKNDVIEKVANVRYLEYGEINEIIEKDLPDRKNIILATLLIIATMSIVLSIYVIISIPN